MHLILIENLNNALELREKEATEKRNETKHILHRQTLNTNSSKSNNNNNNNNSNT